MPFHQPKVKAVSVLRKQVMENWGGMGAVCLFEYGLKSPRGLILATCIHPKVHTFLLTVLPEGC